MQSHTALTKLAIALLVVLASCLSAGCEGQLTGRGRPRITLIYGDAGMPTDAAPRDAGLLFLGGDAGAPDAWVPPPPPDAGPSCVPSCAGRECGGNGCGGSCGTCSAGASCSAVGQCVPPTGGGTHAVTMYGASWCGACHAGRVFLDGNEVEYTYRNIEDPAVQAELVERAMMLGYPLSGSVSLPVMVIDTTMTEGWSESRARMQLDL